ncbi:SCO6880 family protein [Sinomonas sp. ASV322]|uniref:SCO6880 family protein n=1 Tax=Sinomonas sp. ASV322 TaxID=3041920 RepID=UPI0027DC498E|nr:SCO6880 family protein [Sinomonas sp. ASV322]MDQ4504451.1 hypothetical protein [Sinomonas sp. ASV322]
MSRPAYGNITTPRAAGFLGLGMAAAAVAFASIAVAAVLLMVGWLIPAGVVLVVGIWAVVWMARGKRQGRSSLERRMNARRFRKAQRKGTVKYVSGPASRIPDGASRAPGLLAGTIPYEGTDAFGQEFGMLWNPRDRTATVFFSCAGQGRGLSDQSSIDLLVDGWSGFLAQAGLVADLVQIAVTTQATRDPGERLPAAVAGARVNHGTADPVSLGEAGSFVRGTVDEIVQTINWNMPRISQHVALTFSGAEIASEGTVARQAEDMLADLAIQMPALAELLTGAGALTVSRMKIADIVDYAFVAYNPDRALAVERARLNGGTNLSWFEVGPAAAEAGLEHWEHSGYVSRTMTVWKPPAGFFMDDSLTALLLPDGVSEQKRVTMLYRVLGPEESIAALEGDKTNRLFEINQGGKAATAAAGRDLGSAVDGADEQAHGAAVVRFSFVMTSTVPKGPDQKIRLDKAGAALRRACSTGVQMSIRPSDGAHDSGHAIGLGLGLVPATHATVSAAMRKSL